MGFAFLVSAALAAEEWTVPATPEPVAFSIDAVVDLDRGRVGMLLPTARDLVTIWAAMPGQAVQAGDPIVVSSAAIHQRRLRERELDLEQAQRQFAKRELELARERAQLLDERAQAEADLRVAQAALATARAGDPAKVQLLRGRAAEAAGALARAERALVLARTRRDAGEIAADEFLRAEVAQARARDALALAEAELTQAEGGDAVALAKAEARVAQLAARLGLGADGQPDPAAGINGRIAAQENAHRRERRSAQERLDQAQRDLHQAERDAYDHVPLVRLTVRGLVERTFVFGPAALAAPEGAQRAADEAFDAARGWGWTVGAPRPLAREARGPGGARPDGARAGGPRGPRPGGGGGGGPRGGGRPDGASPGEAPALVLVRGRAAFRVALPDGRYTVGVAAGDQLDWDGVVARLATPAGEQPALLVARRIDARRTLDGSAEIDVAGGWLELRLGDAHDKALRAPTAGTAMPREFVATGWKPGWLQDPVAFVLGPQALRLRARLHQDLAPLLRPAGAPAGVAGGDAVDALRRALAVATVEARTAAGIAFRADVGLVSSQPVAPTLRSDDAGPSPLDRFANEALLTVPAEVAPTLRLGESVTCRATLTPPPGAAVLPAHLVARSGERAWIQEAGAAPRAADALRVGARWIVAGIAPGTRLVPPVPPADELRGRAFPGTVAAGRALPVQAGASFGRIESLLPEGSAVRAGEVVATLYNPWLEERREESERQKAAAQETYRIAADQRRVKQLQVAAASREQAAAELVARTALAAAAALDPVALDRALRGEAAARDDAARGADALDRARALAVPDAKRLEDAERRAAGAEVAVRRARLEAAAARHALAWLDWRLADGAWRDAVTQLAAREDELALARAEEKVQALNAELKLANAMQGSRWEQRFLQGREIRAPADGRLFWRTGWNEQTQANAKFEKDFWVWRGMTLADVLDMAHLAFQADVPEDAYPGLAVGAAVEVAFAQRRLPAKITAIAPAFLPTREREADLAAAPVARRRVVQVTVAFEAPEDLRARLVPGTKGTLVLP